MTCKTFGAELLHAHQVSGSPLRRTKGKAPAAKQNNPTRGGMGPIVSAGAISDDGNFVPPLRSESTRLVYAKLASRFRSCSPVGDRCNRILVLPQATDEKLRPRW